MQIKEEEEECITDLVDGVWAGDRVLEVEDAVPKRGTR